MSTPKTAVEVTSSDVPLIDDDAGRSIELGVTGVEGVPCVVIDVIGDLGAGDVEELTRGANGWVEFSEIESAPGRRGTEVVTLVDPVQVVGSPAELVAMSEMSTWAGFGELVEAFRVHGVERFLAPVIAGRPSPANWFAELSDGYLVPVEGCLTVERFEESLFRYVDGDKGQAAAVTAAFMGLPGSDSTVAEAFAERRDAAEQPVAWVDLDPLARSTHDEDFPDSVRERMSESWVQVSLPSHWATAKELTLGSFSDLGWTGFVSLAADWGTPPADLALPMSFPADDERALVTIVLMPESVRYDDAWVALGRIVAADLTTGPGVNPHVVIDAPPEVTPSMLLDDPTLVSLVAINAAEPIPIG